MKDADVWRQEFKGDIYELYDECQICCQFAKTKA